MNPVPGILVLLAAAGAAQTDRPASFQSVRDGELAVLTRGCYRLDAAALPVWAGEVFYVSFLDPAIANAPSPMQGPRQYHDPYVARYAVIPFARLRPVLDEVMGAGDVAACLAGLERRLAAARRTGLRPASVWFYSLPLWLADPFLVADLDGNGYQAGEGIFLLCNRESGAPAEAVVPVRLFAQLVHDDLEAWYNARQDDELRRILGEPDPAVPAEPVPDRHELLCWLPPSR